MKERPIRNLKKVAGTGELSRKEKARLFQELNQSKSPKKQRSGKKEGGEKGHPKGK